MLYFSLATLVSLFGIIKKNPFLCLTHYSIVLNWSEGFFRKTSGAEGLMLYVIFEAIKKKTKFTAFCLRLQMFYGKIPRANRAELLWKD